MDALRGLPASSLAWEADRDERTLRRLSTGASVVAELRWRGGLASEAATGTTADGVWRFDRRGLLDRRVVVEADVGIGAAYASAGWLGGGELTTQLDTQFRFVPTGVMSTRWAFTGPGGHPLVSFLLERRRLFRTEEMVRIEPAGVGGDELGLLVVLGSWLAVLGRRDQASGAGAI